MRFQARQASSEREVVIGRHHGQSPPGKAAVAFRRKRIRYSAFAHTLSPLSRTSGVRPIRSSTLSLTIAHVPPGQNGPSDERLGACLCRARHGRQGGGQGAGRAWPARSASERFYLPTSSREDPRLARALRQGERAQRLGPARPLAGRVGEAGHHRLLREASPGRIPSARLHDARRGRGCREPVVRLPGSLACRASLAVEREGFEEGDGLRPAGEASRALARSPLAQRP
jgi:hypothetical protein